MGDDADSAERDAHWARLVKEAEAAKDRERLAAEKYAREEPARREAARAAQERREAEQAALEAEQAALEAEQAALKAKAELESAERERVRIEAEMRVNGDVEDLDEAAYLHWARRTASARFFVYNAARHANPRDEAQPQPNVSADSRLTSLVRLWTQSGGLIAGLVCMIATEQLIRFESNSVHNFSGYGFVALLLEAAAFATGYYCGCTPRERQKRSTRRQEQLRRTWSRSRMNVYANLSCHRITTVSLLAQRKVI